jgi:hypothetical protein
MARGQVKRCGVPGKIAEADSASNVGLVSVAVAVYKELGYLPFVKG